MRSGSRTARPTLRPAKDQRRSSSHEPDADTATDFLYFSFVTMTTVGFGDLAAAHPVDKNLPLTQIRRLFTGTPSTQQG